MARTTTKRFSLLPELFIIFLLLIVLWGVGVIFYFAVEHMEVIDAIYLSAMTLTTVGYGDFTPQTELGKLFTSAYAFIGIAIFFLDLQACSLLRL